MGFFDKFFNKKEEPSYDSTNIRVQDLNVGFVFDYDMSTWEVQAAYEYDWGDNYFSKEYKIFNGAETWFLSVEEDDELELALTKKVKVRQLGNDIMSVLLTTQKPPAKITFEGKEFFLDGEAPGYFHDPLKGNDSWEEFISWNYEDDSENLLITLEQWDEQEFEASVGKFIEEYEISNILPA